MIQTRLFRNTFILLCIVALLNLAATYLYFYWTVWWFDMLVHFSAGATVGMASILVFWYYLKKQIPSLHQTIKVAIWSVIVIGVAWEIYELVFQLASLSDGLNYYLDTSSDLVMDVSGGILGALYAHRTLLKSN